MPTNIPTSREEFETLAKLLQKRLGTIGDAAWRTSDPAGHLEALRAVSEAIAACHASLKGRIPPRLEHFLANCSYEKALEWLQNELIS